MSIAFIAALVVIAAMPTVLLFLSRRQARTMTRRFQVLEAIAAVGDREGAPEDVPAAIEAVLVPTLADRCTIETDRSAAAAASTSEITVPLRARGEAIGALTLTLDASRRHYGADDAAFAHVLAGRVALALDNAGLFSDLGRSERARAEIAETLQRGLLPPPLPHIPGWSAAAMYRPAGAENEVGGDFYDAFPVEGGWMIVIGDVTGRGARAASITGQARYTLRTAAVLTGDPLVALATLNRALLARRDSALCSVAALALSEDPRAPVRIAVAGHPPPLLVDGEAVIEAGTPGPLLGAFAGAEWRLERALVEPGQQLVVITDGITEAPGAEGRFGEERLRAELAGAASPVLAVQRLEGALHDFTAGRLDDDAAMLAIARSSDGAAGSSGLDVEALRPLAAA
jgi:hypothetical protein